MDLKPCRTCGGYSGERNIFAGLNGVAISTKIMFCCAKLSVVEGDGLPAHICAPCELELEAAVRFVLKTEATDRRLRALRSSHHHDTQSAANLVKGEEEVKIEVKSEDCYSLNEEHFANEDFPEEPQVDVKFEHDLVLEPKGKKYTKKKLIRNEFECSICSRKLTSARVFALHMRRHPGESPFPCPACDKKYNNHGSLKRHTSRHHSAGAKERYRNYICETCGKGFYSKNDVKIHTRTHTGETPFACTECPKRFTQVGALRRHEAKHSSCRPHTCSNCPKRFTTKEGLASHQAVHSQEKKFLCTVCQVPFKYQNNLKKHMVLHTEPNSYICNYCGRAFNQKGNLKGHIDRLHTEKSGHCNECAKNVPNIEEHMWRHTGQRPLKCKLCPSSFFELKSLAKHVNFRHKNVDKFICGVEGCGLKFPARSMLEFHTVKVHDTKIPFPCDRCSRGFYRKNDLARHKIGTHKERLV